MKIIVGLGNPGEKYKNTRHNVGFIILDQIIREADDKWSFNKKFNAETCQISDTIFVKPQTFMNNSGQAVQAILSYYNLTPKKFGIIRQKEANLSHILTVIHDDVDIEIGKYKTVTDSGSAGHNGLKSIINHLKTQDFRRIKVGISNEFTRSKIPTEKFVMQNFAQPELEVIKNIAKEIEL